MDNKAMKLKCKNKDNSHYKWDGIEDIKPDQALWMLKNQIEAELYKRNNKRELTEWQKAKMIAVKSSFEYDTGLNFEQVLNNI